MTPQTSRSAKIHQHRPWEKSTGPRTPEGKRSSMANLPGRERQAPTLAELTQRRIVFERLYRWHIRNPKASALFAMADPHILRDIVAGYLGCRVMAGLSLGEAEQEIRRIRDAELRHAHRLKRGV